MDTPVYSGKHDGVYSQDSTNIFCDQTRIFVGFSDDGKTVLNAVVPGDAQEEWDKMPEGYQYDFITEYAVKRTEWNPYLNPNRGGTDTVEKEAAIAYCPLSEFESKVKEAQERIPGSEYGYFVYEDAQRNKEKGAVICDMVTNNWLVVPEWSDNVDAVMHFLDWMFGTQEAHDLFQYGIEGEDWESVGEEGYRQLDISEDLKYTMPNYSFTLNPTYIRYSEFVLNDAELKADFDYIYDEATYRLSPLSGFSFDATNVETEVANISALSNELQLNISLYDADEAKEKLAAWHADATALYEVLLKMEKNQEGYVGASFLRAFGKNIKSATLVWIPLFAAKIVFGVNLFYYAVFGGGSFRVQRVVFAILLLLAVALSGYAFPVLARFENTAAGTLRMAAVLAVRNPGWTALILFMRILTVAVCCFFLFFPVLFIMGITGYFQAVIFNHIFDKLIAEGKIVEVNGAIRQADCTGEKET